MKTPLLLAVLCLLAAPFAAGAAAPPEEPKVRIDLVAGASAAAPGASIPLLLRQSIAPGWHTYWINPGDSGDSPDLQFALPPGASAGPLAFPWPRRLPYGPLMNFGYEDEVLMPFSLTLADDFAGYEVVLEVSGALLVCADICIPQAVAASLRLPVGEGAPEPSAASLFEEARARLPVPLQAAADYQLADGMIHARVMLPMAAGHRIASIAYFPFTRHLVKSAAEQGFAVDEEGLSLRLVPGYDFRPGADLSGVLVVREAVGDGIESAYELQLPAAITAAAPSGMTLLPTPPTAAATGMTLLASKPTAAVPAGMNLAIALAFAFMGGLILNLMPCVFPVLSIKILSLVGGVGKGSMRLHGWVYAAGVVASFLALALALILLRLSGETLGWGFQLQSPLIVALLAYLFVLIGLNLFGVFEVGTSVMSLGSGAGGKPGSLAASFGTGVLATTVAAPCTAPFMGAALGYALTQPPLLGLAVFASLGAGMAAPYLALCHAPALVRRLPRPGAWMESVKQFLAFPMLASALWLLWVLGHQTGPNGMAQALTGALLLALAVWLFSWNWLAKAMALLLCASALYLAASLAPSQPSATTPSSAAQTYSAAALAAAREQGAVLVNFTAAWCITCKVNELNALSSAAFHAALKRHQVTYLKADWTSEDPTITKALQAQGRSGVPLYLYYAPGAPQPEVLPQLLTESLVLRTLAGN